jgi:hypothetical protein
MVTWGMQPLGALPAGALAEAHGARLTVFLGGAICLVFALAMLLLAPRLREDTDIPGSRTHEGSGRR